VIIFIESLQFITTNNTTASAHNLQTNAGYFSASVLMPPLDGGWLSLLNLPSVIKVQHVALSFLRDGQIFAIKRLTDLTNFDS
jgi:hypothetical protein